MPTLPRRYIHAFYFIYEEFLRTYVLIMIHTRYWLLYILQHVYDTLYSSAFRPRTERETVLAN